MPWAGLMNTPDCLLIGWWALAVITFVSVFAGGRWQRQREFKAATLAYLRGQTLKSYALPTLLSHLPRPIRIIITIFLTAAIVVLILGLIASLWVGYWTQLYVLHVNLLLALFGSACLFAPQSAAANLPAFIPKIVGRLLFISFGILGVGFGVGRLVGDLALPPIILEGHVNRSGDYWSRRGYSYFIVLDGRRYDAIYEAILPVNVGDRVRAEVGAGSHVILRTEPM
jgi:hypothetical protein